MLNSDETAINSLSADNEVTTRPVKTGERIPLLLRKRLFGNFFNFSHRNEENNGYVLK